MGARRGSDGVESQKRRTELARLRNEESQHRLAARRNTLMLSLAGSYTRTNRLRTGSRARLASADAHRDRRSREDMMADAGGLLRTTPQARSIVQRLVDMVVSDGFGVEPETASDEINTQYEEYFNAWADRLDGFGFDLCGRLTVDGAAALCVKAACRDGDIGWLATALGSYQGIEAARFVNPGGKPDGKNLRGGIELGEFGRAIAYHIAEWSDQGTFLKTQTTPRPASQMLFLANPLQEDLNACRGEPQLAAVIDKFEHLDEYDLAVRTAARMAACLGLVTKTQNPAALQANWSGELQTPGEGSADSEKDVEFKPGMVFSAMPGDDVMQIQGNQPGTNYQDFMFVQTMISGSELSMPLFLSVLDGRQVNLASMRAMIRLVFRNFYRWQRWLELRFYRPVYLFAIARGIRTGDLPFVPDWDKHSWVAPPAPMMDEKQEVDGAMAAVNGLLRSRSDVTKSIYGVSFKRVLKRLEEEKKQMDAAGLAPVGMPGQTMAGAAPSDNGSDGTTNDGSPDAGDETTGTGDPAKAKGSRPSSKAGASKGPAQAADGASGFLVGDKTLAADLVKGVAGKTISAESATAILTTMVNVSPEDAGSIINPADGFEQPKPAPAPVKPTP